jgi:hypothetical protein
MAIVPDLAWRHQTFGNDALAWQQAKLEVRSHLIETARRRSIITYMELAQHIVSVKLPRTGAAFGSAIGLILGQVSADESDRLGKPMMLAAVAVNVNLKPGPGFLGLVNDLGWPGDWSDWLVKVWKQYA